MTFAAAIDRVNRAVQTTFGDPATLAGQAVIGIYQAPFVEGFGIASTSPTFRTRTADAPSPNGATLVCSAGTFKVRSHQPDGAGWSVLVLEAP